MFVSYALFCASLPASFVTYLCVQLFRFLDAVPFLCDVSQIDIWLLLPYNFSVFSFVAEFQLKQVVLNFITLQGNRK